MGGIGKVMEEGHGGELIGGLDTNGDGVGGGEREGDDVNELGREGGEGKGNEGLIGWGCEDGEGGSRAMAVVDEVG